MKLQMYSLEHVAKVAIVADSTNISIPFLFRRAVLLTYINSFSLAIGAKEKKKSAAGELLLRRFM